MKDIINIEVIDMAVVVVSPMGYVDKIENGKLKNWTYVTKGVEYLEIDKFDETKMDYELNEIDLYISETWWERDDNGEEYHGDITDIMARYHYNEKGQIVVDYVGLYWREQKDELAKILRRRFKKKVVFENRTLFLFYS